VRLLSLLVVLVIIGFGVKLAVESAGGGTSSSGGSPLDPAVVTQAQGICSRAFTPPLIRFPPNASGPEAAAFAAGAKAKADPMLTQLEPAITSTPQASAFTLITSYRNLITALATFPATGGDAAEQNIMQLAEGVSQQARELGIPACAPG
jgi:hypothetical protein